MYSTHSRAQRFPISSTQHTSPMQAKHHQQAVQDRRAYHSIDTSPFATESLASTTTMMDQISPILELPSPTNSYHYIYGDAEQHLDTHASGSQSPLTSQYDMSYVQDFGLGADIYPSPEGECEPESPQQQDASASTSPSTETPAKTPAKRKRENRYKNAPPSVLSRRRAQNRASQRAYRERKDQRIKDLEQMLNDSKQRNDHLTQAFQNLQGEYLKLRTSQQMTTDPTAAAAATYASAAGMGGFDQNAVDLLLGSSGGGRGMDMGMFGGYHDIATYSHM